MNADDFEKHLARQPFRPLPPEWREAILAAARPCPASPAAIPGSEAASWWRSLLWPSPLAWGGVAAAWAVILALNLDSLEPGEPRAARTQAAHFPNVRLTLTMLRQVEAELEQTELPTPAEPAPPAPVLRPRSQRLAVPEQRGA